MIERRSNVAAARQRELSPILDSNLVPSHVILPAVIQAQVVDTLGVLIASL